jgi:hypothetical protein
MTAWRKSSFSPNGGSCVEVGWRKSTFSPNGDSCVEIAWPAISVAVRDSKDTSGPTLGFPRSSWGAFLEVPRGRGIQQ